MKKPEIMTPQEWEAEAVDFMPVELEKMFAKDVLSYAIEAQSFIFRTMTQMELRPKRSLVRKAKK